VVGREHEILEKLDERSKRLDRWIEETGNPLLMEIRAEFELSRISYEHQLQITTRLVERNMDVMDEVVAAIRGMRNG